MVSESSARAAVRPAAQVASAQVSIGQRCYQVGQKVSVKGSGFTAAVPYDISVDGVEFGQSETSASGAFTSSLYPGGLGAGQAQIADQLTASDGTTSATAKFTITRATGALFGAGSGGSPQRLVPFEVWDFAPRGPKVSVYLHYVAPDGKSTHTTSLGTTAGQCGSLVTSKKPLFPFSPGKGTWTLQFDTSASYSAAPTGKVARLRVAIS
jgi:hypothetical protein